MEQIKFDSWVYAKWQVWRLEFKAGDKYLVPSAHISSMKREITQF